MGVKSPMCEILYLQTSLVVLRVPRTHGNAHRLKANPWGLQPKRTTGWGSLLATVILGLQLSVACDRPHEHREVQPRLSMPLCRVDKSTLVLHSDMSLWACHLEGSLQVWARGASSMEAHQ